MLDISTNLPVLLGLAGLTLLFLHAWRSERRIAALQRENGNLARSIDAIMRSPSRDAGKQYLSQADLAQRIREELVWASGSSPAEPNAATMASDTGTPDFVPPAREAHLPGHDEEAFGAKLAAIIAEDRLEISLQPIVSVSLGQSVAFDVLTPIDLPQGGPIHLKRISGGSVLDPVDFDMSMFLVAVDTARRRLGSVSERMKLHLSLSEHVLQHQGAISDICSLVEIHPGISRSIVISLPPQAGRRPDLAGAVRTLYDAGFSLALESDAGRPANGLKLPPLEYVKIDAGVLTAIADSMIGDVAAQLPVRLWPDGCPPLVALGVESEETAMRLIDLGIDRMAGDWFSPPRRMQQAVPALVGEPGTTSSAQG